MDKRRIRDMRTIITAGLFSAAAAFSGWAGQWEVKAEQLLGRQQKQKMEAGAQTAAQENRVQLYWSLPAGYSGSITGPNGGIPEGAIFTVPKIWYGNRW